MLVKLYLWPSHWLYNRPMNHLVIVAKMDDIYGSKSWALSYQGCSNYDHSCIAILHFYRVLYPTSQNTLAQEPRAESKTGSFATNAMTYLGILYVSLPHNFSLLWLGVLRFRDEMFLLRVTVSVLMSLKLWLSFGPFVSFILWPLGKRALYWQE